MAITSTPIRKDKATTAGITAPATQAKWDMLGAQFDFDGRNNYTGQFYEQATGRGIIAWRGPRGSTPP